MSLKFRRSIGAGFALAALALGMVACSSPLVVQQREANVRFTFLVHGLKSAEGSAISTGSKLLLPTANSLTVSLTPLSADLPEVKPQTVAITSGSTSVPVQFLSVKIGLYTLKAEAASDGKVLFRQVSEVELTENNPAITLNLLPVAPEGGFPTASSRSINATIPVNSASTWELPVNGAIFSTNSFYYYSADANVSLYIQSADGTLLTSVPSLSDSTSRAIQTSSLLGQVTGKVYLTVHNAGSGTAQVAIGSNSSMKAVTGGALTGNGRTGTFNLSDYSMGVHEVTSGQFAALTGLGSVSDPELPAANLTWFDAVEYCNKLSAIEGLDAVYMISERTPVTGSITGATVTADFAKNGYRLPTEAEWEWAALGGKYSANIDFAGSGGTNAIGDFAWYSVNSLGVSHAIGSKNPNALGLYDMSGNVEEWCHDRDRGDPNTLTWNYAGGETEIYRVLRGGNFSTDVAASYLGISWNSRRSEVPIAANVRGFRIARNAAPRYTVTYDLNGGTGTVPLAGLYVQGTALTMPAAPTREGYAFAGWNLDGTANTYAAGDTPNSIAAPMTFKATWTGNTYAITFNSEGGTAATGINAIYGSPIGTMPSPTKINYIFGGWFDGAGGTGTPYTDTTVYSVVGPMTLYARWVEAGKYTLSYSANNGSGTIAPVDYFESASVTVASASWSGVTRNGYTFSAWNTAANGTGTSYAENASLTMPASAVTLYAQWTPVNYTITYELDGGTNGSNPTSYTIESGTITFSAPTKTDFTFGGWYLDAPFTTTKSTIPTGSTGNVTVYAKWVTGGTITVSLNNPTDSAATLTSGGSTISAVPQLDRSLSKSIDVTVSDTSYDNYYWMINGIAPLPVLTASGVKGSTVTISTSSGTALAAFEVVLTFGNGTPGTYQYSKRFSLQVVDQHLSLGLVGCWKLDGTTDDSSGTGANGTAFGSPSSVSNRKSIAGKAYQFTTTDGITVPHNAAFAISSSEVISASVWFKGASVPAFYAPILVQKSKPTYLDWSIGLDNTGKLYGAVNKNDGGSAMVTVTTSLGDTWHHAVLTFDRNAGVSGSEAVKLYLDGSLIGSAAWTLGEVSGAPEDEGLQLGSSNFAGAIDDVRIYNRVLTASDVGFLNAE